MNVDFVTAVDTDLDYGAVGLLRAAIRFHEPRGGYRLITVDSRARSRPEPVALNLGAFHPKATSPLIGFLGPQLRIAGPFLGPVAEAVAGGAPVVHGGEALFVARSWFASVGGFAVDTSVPPVVTLIRRARDDGQIVVDLQLPIHHQSPEEATSP